MRRTLLIIFVILLSGCTLQEVKRRTPASYYWRPGVLSLANSQVRMLSIKTVNHEQAYFFYFEGRDQLGELIDFDPYELSFQTRDHHLTYDFFRENLGKYYYRIFFKNIPATASSLTVFLAGEPLSEIQLKHQDSLAVTDIKKSRIRILRYENHTYFFELELLDSQGRPVKSRERPEFLIEGDASLQGLSLVGTGKWRGELRVLDTNSIIYLSPRLNSSHLPRLLRIQHIEK